MAFESEPRSEGLLIPPRQHHRRGSLDSVTSALSDFSILSHEHHMPNLTRLDSNTSVSSAYSISGRASLRQKLSNLYDQNYGALLVLLSQIFGSLMNIFTRLLEHDGGHGTAMHPFQILFARQSITAVLCTIYAVTTKSIPHFPLGPPDRRVRLLLVLRGLTGFFGVFGMYFALLYLPLSEATVLTFLAPILSCYLCSYMIPGETFTRQQQMAAFLSLIGVVFMAQPLSLFAPSTPPPTSTGADVRQSQPSLLPNTTVPISGSTSASLSNTPTPSQHLLAIAVSMVGVLGATGAYTTIRAIGTRAHAFISVNYFSVWSSIVSLVALIVIPSVKFRLPANVTEWALLISLGSCGFVMQALLTMGLAYKTTGKGGGTGQPKVGQKSRAEAPVSTSISNSTDINTDVELQDRHPSIPHAESSTGNDFVSTDPSTKHRARTRPSSSSSGTKATSMVYTQMLFALAADRIVFGTTPGLWSWVGSGLILAGAIWVASARDKPTQSSKADYEPSQQDTTDHVPVKQPEESIGLLTEEHPISDDEQDSHHE